MAVVLEGGPILLGCTRSEEGYREYTVQHLVRSGTLDGPANVLQCPGLPIYGQRYSFLSDLDVWVWCRQRARVSPAPGSRPGAHPGLWTVEQTFSNQPIPRNSKENQVDNPVQQPPKVSGSWARYAEEVSYDRFGHLITNSAYEQIRGAPVEFDKNRPQIRIEQNFLQLNLGLLYSMRDCVNAFPLWGFPRRCIKLSNASWEVNNLGTPQKHYTRTLEFDIDVRQDFTKGTITSGWDRDLLDEGTKALSGEWRATTGLWTRIPVPATATLNPSAAGVLDPANPKNPDPSNPQHYTRFKDRNGENMKVVLNGAGLPFGASGGYGGAIAATVDATTGKVDSLSISTGGSNYSSKSFIRIKGGGGRGAAGKITVTAGVITAVTLTSAGFFYTSPPEVTIFSPEEPGTIHVEYYPEADFLLLGIPTQF